MIYAGVGARATPPAVGGTGHTLRVAKTYNIPIRNLWSEGMK